MGRAKETSQDRPKDGAESGDMAVALQSGTPKHQLQFTAHESICNAATTGVILLQLLQAWLQHQWPWN